MSQEFDQNIFSFSNGFERSEEQQHHVAHQIPRGKLTSQILGAAPPTVGMVEVEEDELPTYESGGIFSDMFNFSSGTATELLESQISQTYRNPREAADWFLHRQDAADGGLENSKNQAVINDTTASYNHHHQISSINADSAAAMQLFLMNPQQRSASPSPSPASASLHMLLPNHSSSSSSSSSSFHTASAAGAFGQFTWPPNPNQILEGQGLSLSLSSSLEAAKAEELRLGLLFGQAAETASPHYHQLTKNFATHTRQLQQVGLGPSFNMLSNSKYVKAAQELLEEFCSVGRAHLKKNKIASKQPSAAAAAAGGDSSSKDLPPISASERLEHQRRKVKLSSMLDEIDRRYNHYCERMQMVVNSFDMIMGFGAATPYTSLAQKAMSRHFRCLREAVSDQLKHSCEQLGEKDSSKSGLTKGETPRLKFLEQSLRQQRAFHQMGMVEQEAWRPQRGLPQRSLTILRAWLFEHFLHPYPSDADKHLLARQTGLSRNQVANWFINARVRLWKPMVEEMYLQEAKEEESEDQNRDQTTTAAVAQTPTTTTTTAALTPPPPAKINMHENDPSFISFNTSENHPHTNHVPPPLPTSTAASPQCFPAAMHDAESCRKAPPGMIKFGTNSGDVSLTLGLRHSGNLPEKSSFSVRDLGSC